MKRFIEAIKAGTVSNGCQNLFATYQENIKTLVLRLPTPDGRGIQENDERSWCKVCRMAMIERIVNNSDEPAECPACRDKREYYQAIGLVVFSFTIVSFGLLAPITLPTTIFLVFYSWRRCDNCRKKRKTGQTQISSDNEATPDAS